MKHRLILWGWAVLAWFPVPRRWIKENHVQNEKILQSNQLWTPGSYIEDQSGLKGLRFGKAYTMAYGGCGLIALYNALLALGEPVTPETFLVLAEDFQRRGVAWGGKYGIHPAAIRKWLGKKGYKAEKLVVREAVLFQSQDAYAVFIATVFNGTKITDGLHTVCITRSERGFEVHNAPARGPFESLHEALCEMTPKGAVPIYVTGVETGEKGLLGKSKENK